MRRPLAYSVVLHLLVIGIVAFGLPALAPRPLIVEEPMVVDLVPLDERVNPPPATRPAPVPEAARPAAPKPARDERPEPLPKPAEPKVAARPEPAPAPPKPAPPKAEPKTEPRPEPPRSAPKPEPKAEKPEPKPQPAKPEPPKPEPARAEPRPAAPKPEAPKPEPKAVARAEPEEPKPQAKPRPPEPRAEAKADQKPEPKSQPKPEKAEPKVAPAERKPEPARPSPATAQRKPEPGDDFASVLKTVDELKQSGRTEVKPSSPPSRKAEAGDPEFGAQVAQALRSAGPAGKPTLPVTASEIDAVRRQIERCWNLPAGVKDAGDLVVSIRVEMNADGTPRSAVVDGSSRGQGNPLFQATADSARRAVLNPRCHPFKLPADKFDRWRTMTLIFNPREMAGT